MSKLLIRALDTHDPAQLESSIDLVEQAFADLQTLSDKESVGHRPADNYPVSNFGDIANRFHFC